MTEKLKMPWYPWYPRDHAGDGPVQLMSLAAEGAYRLLLDYQWLNGSIPSDAKSLAAICKHIPVRNFNVIWGGLRSQFVRDSAHPGHLINRRLERIREERKALADNRSGAGRRGAEARWGTPSDNGNRMGLPLANRSQPEAEAEAESESEISKEPAPARSRPSQRGSAGERGEAVDYVIRVTGAANRGLAANPAYSVEQGFNELVASAQTVQADWIAAGVPVALAEQAVYELARHYKPKGHRRQPGSLSYFRAAVLEAHERAQGAAASSEVGGTEAERLIAKWRKEEAEEASHA